MPDAPRPDAPPTNVPEGYAAAPIPALGEGAVRVGVLVKAAPDPVGGALVLLRQTLDARVYLACLLDAAGRIHAWAELWVQSAEAAQAAPAGVRDALTPEVLAARWDRMVAAYDAMERPLLVRTGFEGRPAPELVAKGPAGPIVVSPASAAATAGGRIMVRAFGPHGLEAFASLLSSPALGGSRPRAGVPHGDGVIDLDRAFGLSAPDGGSLFLGVPGRWGRIVEALHLKLRLLADCVDAAGTMVERAGRPLLNLRPESFQVRLGEPARGLPQWWTARAVLCDPGDAVALPVPAGDERYFLSASVARPSVYRPESIGLAGGGGRGRLRISRVVPGEGPDAIVEAALVTDERVRMTASDLVWIRAGVGADRVDLYARPDGDAVPAQGELRLRTLPQALTPAARSSLEAAAGVPLSDVAFEVVPHLSTPVDLYALGVLAVRLLLVGKGVALPAALDEMLSLARQANAVAQDSGAAPWEAVAHVFGADDRWTEALGPQRLTDDGLTPADAMGVVTPEVWFRTLGAIVATFPGPGPLSRCRDLGDARPGGLAAVFADASSALDDLLRRTRSLIVIDWNANREVHAVLRRFSTGVGAGPAGARAGAGR